MKTLIVAILLAGVIPLLLGLLFELVIVAPLRVPLDQTPLFYPWQVIWVRAARPAFAAGHQIKCSDSTSLTQNYGSSIVICKSD